MFRLTHARQPQTIALKRALGLQSRLGLYLALAIIGPAQALAQAAPGNAGGITLPGSPGQPPSNGPACVQVQITGQKPSPYDCLNQQLEQQVQGANPTQPKLPLSADSPSNQVGTFNEQSLAEQYGQNFGKSAIPYRPPVPVYSNPLRP